MFIEVLIDTDTNKTLGFVDIPSTTRSYSKYRVAMFIHLEEYSYFDGNAFMDNSYRADIRTQLMGYQNSKWVKLPNNVSVKTDEIMYAYTYTITYFHDPYQWGLGGIGAPVYGGEFITKTVDEFLIQEKYYHNDGNICLFHTGGYKVYMPSYEEDHVRNASISIYKNKAIIKEIVGIPSNDQSIIIEFN